MAEYIDDKKMISTEIEKKRGRDWVFVLLLLLSLALWGFSIPNINVEDISFDGLISVLPISFFASFIVLTISFFLLISHEREKFTLLFLHALVLILIIHGTLAVVYDAPRYPWTYRVIGMVSYVQKYGSVAPDFGAYYYWPGFFILIGFLSEALGFESSMSFTLWAQFIFNSLYLIALLFIFRGLTINWKRVWIALWFFFLSSWIGQDLFAPQALNYFYYLMFMGITIRWFVQERELKWQIKLRTFLSKFFPPQKYDARPDIKVRETQKVVTIILLLMLYFLIVTGHQLTPFMVISGILFITVFAGHQSKTISILLAVILASWIMYAAWGFVEGHAHFFEKILKIYENIYDSLFLRYNFKDVPVNHQSMLIAGYLLTGSIWLLAFIGTIRRMRKGYREKIAIALALSPFVMLFLFTYGGEILFRVYFFSLPWTAYLASAVLYPDGLMKFRWQLEGLGYKVLSLALFLGLILSYFGNEIIYHIPEDEVAVVQTFYDEAPHGSLLYTPLLVYPSSFVADFNLFEYKWIIPLRTFREGDFDEDDIDEILAVLGDDRYPEAYFLVTNVQLNFIDLYNITPDGVVIRLLEDLLATNQFEVIAVNPDAVLLRYIGDGEGN